MILTRSVPAEGRSRAWVDGRMAPLSALGEAAAELVEIHGQHEHRALVTPAAQRNVLDAFAGTDLSRVRAIRSQLQAIDEALAALGGDAQQRAREADVLRYQVEEIAEAHLRGSRRGGRAAPGGGPPGRRRRPTATPRSRRSSWSTPPARAEQWSCSAAPAPPWPGARLREPPRPSGRRRRGGVRPGPHLRDEVEGWEDDPQRLIDVQERRRLLGELRRKYGEDLGAVMTYGREGAVRLAALENAEGEAARLQAERDRRLLRAGRRRGGSAQGQGQGRRIVRRPGRRAAGSVGHVGRPPRGARRARGGGRAD